MPFDKTKEIAGGVIHMSDFDKPEPSFLETTGAAFRQENLIGSAIVSPRMSMSGSDFYKIKPDYNPFDDMEGYEDHADRFEESYNPQATAAIKAGIDREKKDDETRLESGLSGAIMSMVAGVADLTTLIPGGALVKSGRVGMSVGKSAMAVGIGAGVGTAVQEAGLQATQETRTAGESALNIGGSVILGGVIGAAGAKFLSKGEWTRFSKTLEKELAEDVPDAATITDTIVTRMQSAGASSVDEIKLDDLGIGGGRAVQAIAKATDAARLNPGIQTMFSPSVKVREIYQQLVDNPVYTRMEMEGRTLGGSVENNVKMLQRGALAKWVKTSRQNFKDAKKAGFKGSKSEFYDRVARAGRRNDVDELGDDYVSATARAAREGIFDPTLQRSIELGLLPEDVKTTTAASYVTRFWNRQRLIGEEGRFRDIARNYFRGVIRDQQSKQEEIRIARDISAADDLNERFTKSLERVDRVSERLEGRAKVRERKLSAILKTEGERFDVLKGRVPKHVLDVAKTAKDDRAMLDAVREVSKAPKKQAARPVIGLLKSRGGVQIGSPLEGELLAMGVTPKTSPGLFKKNGGLTAVDNFPASEEPLFSGMARDGNGYADPNDILDAIRSEMSGAPIRTDDELFEEAARDVLEQNVEQWLSEIGLPPNATAKQVREYLDKVVGNEKKLDTFDQRINRMNGELEEFDRLTDDLASEKLIADAEAGKYADELNSLEEKINAVREFANASPRVKIMVDYADARKAYAKGRYDQTRITNRIEAIERVDAEGRSTPEMIAELRALRADKNAIDEKVIKAGHKRDKLKPMLPKDRGENLDFIDDADFDDYVEEAVTGVFNNLTGRGQGDVPEWLVPVTRGPLKERTFNIDDELIEDFLENDMEAILHRYVRVVGAETEIAAKFGRADMKDQFDAIGKDYDELSKKAKTAKEREALEAKRTRDVGNLTAFRDLVRGTYKAADEGSSWSKATRAALTWNYIRLLGGVALTSITDASRPIAVHGVRATMKEALPALTSGLKAAKISRADARDLGAITEVVLQSRLATLADIQDPYAVGSKYERFLANSSNIFSKATGLSYWNDGMKTIASVMTQNRMARNVMSASSEINNPQGGKTISVDYKRIDDAESKYLAFLGIDENMAGRISAQIKKHGVEQEGIWGANVSQWKDDAAKRAWASALNKDVDRTIITKGVADQPLWTRTNWGKLIFQFKSFAMASHQRALIAGLQENQLRLAESMIFATALGMLVSYLKFAERGDMEQANRLIENPGLWVSNGLDRTGILSVLFEVSNTGEKLGLPVGITTGIQKIAGDKDQGGTVSRYASRNKLGAVLGPSAGLFQDLGTIAEQLSAGDLKKSGANAIVRQIPGASLPGARSIMHGFVKPAFSDAVE